MPRLSESSSEDEGPISADIVKLFASGSEEIGIQYNDDDGRENLNRSNTRRNASSGKCPGKTRGKAPVKKSSNVKNDYKVTTNKKQRISIRLKYILSCKNCYVDQIILKKHRRVLNVTLPV